MKSRRLFLLAGYNAKNVVDASLVYMAKSLSEFGDVILVMDSDVPDTEMHKVAPYTIFASARRHGEYDFGSYKRAYIYAQDTGILGNYEFVYMINDSVYGPVNPLLPALEKLESTNRDAFGLVYNANRKNPHIQSWFIGMRKPVFASNWFDKFITSVSRQPNKGLITYFYEQGFSRMLFAHNIKFSYLYTAPGRKIYNNVKYFYKSKCPFFKKVAFTRHYGRLGGQLSYILSHLSPDLRNIILTSARDAYGTEYIDWLLTRNPIKILYRSCRYFFYKLFGEGI